MIGESYTGAGQAVNRQALLPVYYKTSRGRFDLSRDAHFVESDDDQSSVYRSYSMTSIPRSLPDYTNTGSANFSEDVLDAKSGQEALDVQSVESRSSDLPATDIVIPPARTDLPVPKPDNMEKVLAFFTLYRKFFTLAMVLNCAALIAVTQRKFGYGKRNVFSFALGNLMASILARNEFALRIAYWLVVQTLFWTPIRVRNMITGTFVNLGGIHSGCATAGLIWTFYAAYVAFRDNVYPHVVKAFAILTPLTLALSIAVAMPYIRHHHHNVFEKLHRFTGWLGLAYLWILVVLLQSYDPSSHGYRPFKVHWAKKQELWYTVFISVMIVAPWLTVQRIAVNVSAPSAKTAFLTFPGGCYTGLIGRLSRSPWLEWHAFGIISEGPLAFTHHMLIVAQGDWTKALISDPPKYLWTRGLRFAGLPYLAEMYERGVIVATGAGLGVTLSVYLQTKGDFHLIWIGSDLEKTYGQEVMALMTKAVNGQRATLIDTKKTGRPDTVQLIDNVYRQMDAQVVFVTSNPAGTELIVNGCRARGLTAFGPLFDS